MARKKKETVDYFPHFVTSGKTLFVLENAYGNDGYAFWYKLLETLGAIPTFCFDANKEADWEYLLAKARTDKEKAFEMLNLLAKLEAIDKDLWNSKKLIWVQNLVDNVVDVFKKRGTEIPTKPLFLSQKCKVNGVSGNKSTQTKTKKIKLNKIKLNKTITIGGVSATVIKFKIKSNDKPGTDPEQFVEVLNYYCMKAAVLEINLKPKEYETAQLLLSSKIPVLVIKRGIDEAFANYKPKFDGDKIKSFNYCRDIIKALWEKEKVKEANIVGDSRGYSEQKDSSIEGIEYDFSKYGGK